MVACPIDRDRAESFFAAVEQALREGFAPKGVSVNARVGERSALRVAAERLGIPTGSVNSRYEATKRVLGRDIDWTLARTPSHARPERTPEPSVPQQKPRYRVKADGSIVRVDAEPQPFPDLAAMLRRQPMSVDEIAAQTGASQSQVTEEIARLEREGFNVRRLDNRFTVDKDLEPGFIGGPVFEYVSRPDNTFVFGATSDNHIGSKYSRLDVLEDLYRQFEEAGVDRVFNAGNWIDGEARFNKFDLDVHGMDAQCRYLAQHYPSRPGIVTYAVAGDDHEGWYAQREGVNIGRYAENAMRAAGRADWFDLGYMEAHVRLVNANSGKSSILSVVHPGGGSAYALSYSIQKIIESLEGGEKPAVGLYGHYHKLWAGNIRNVWCVQTGCTEDQTPFMRKKRLEAHVGGAIIGLRQDPATGAIVAMRPELIRYFNRSYYNGRWSHSDAVVLPERAA